MEMEKGIRGASQASPSQGRKHMPMGNAD